MDHGGHQKDLPNSTQRFPARMASGVWGRTYGSTVGLSARLLIGSFIFACAPPPTPANMLASVGANTVNAVSGAASAVAGGVVDIADAVTSPFRPKGGKEVAKEMI